MPPSICARMMSGLTATPQSTAHHTLWTSGTVVAHRHLHDLRHEGIEAFDHRDAAGAAGRELGVVPIGEFGDRLEHAGVARLVGHQREPAFDRILARGFQQLVDEGLDRVAGVGVADRAPPQHGHTDIDLVQVALEIRNLVGNLVGALTGGGIHAVLDHRLERRALHDRLADDGVGPAPRSCRRAPRRACGGHRNGR